MCPLVKQNPSYQIACSQLQHLIASSLTPGIHPSNLRDGRGTFRHVREWTFGLLAVQFQPGKMQWTSKGSREKCRCSIFESTKEDYRVKSFSKINVLQKGKCPSLVRIFEPRKKNWSIEVTPKVWKSCPHLLCVIEEAIVFAPFLMVHKNFCHFASRSPTPWHLHNS